MSVIDEYLKELPKPHRFELEKILKIAKQQLPEAEEVISYGMPGLKYKGKYLLGFNAFKDHLSLFPTSHPIKMLRLKLKDYKISKGTIQFTMSKPIPEAIIKELINIRKDDILKS